MSKINTLPAYVTDLDGVKKHPQFVLAVDNAYFSNSICLPPSGEGWPLLAFADSVNVYSYDHFVQDVVSQLVICEREMLDNSICIEDSTVSPSDTLPRGNPYYRQVLPYVVARQKQPDGSYVYYRYRRTKGVGESRLAGNGSIGYGGHVDLADIVHHNSVIDLPETLALAMIIR